MNTRKLLLLLMVLCMTGLTSGCAVSRMYVIEVEEGGVLTITLNGLEVYKEGITEGQEAKPELDVNLIPGM